MTHVCWRISTRNMNERVDAKILFLKMISVGLTLSIFIVSEVQVVYERQLVAGNYGGSTPWQGPRV